MAATGDLGRRYRIRRTGRLVRRPPGSQPGHGGRSCRLNRIFESRSYPVVMYPRPWIRVSDADREAVVAHLSAAAAEGRLTLNEFSERARLAYASTTAGELATLVRDLPIRPGA